MRIWIFLILVLGLGIVSAGIGGNVGIDLNKNPLDIKYGGNYTINTNYSQNSNLLDGYDSSYFYPYSNPFQFYNVTGDTWLYDSATTLFFNESKLATTFYNATSLQNVTGTYQGTIQLTQHPDGDYDDVTLNITERVSAPALDFRFNFTDGLTKFNTGYMRYKTSNLFGDAPVIQLWDYDSMEWETYAYLSESLNFVPLTQNILDSSDHVQSGTVQMRLYKSGTGNINNEYFIDLLAIADGFATPSGNVDLSPYWRRDGGASATGNWDLGNYNLATNGNITIGYKNTSQIRIVEAINTNYSLDVNNTYTPNTGAIYNGVKGILFTNGSLAGQDFPLSRETYSVLRGADLYTYDSLDGVSVGDEFIYINYSWFNAKLLNLISLEVDSLTLGSQTRESFDHLRCDDSTIAYYQFEDNLEDSLDKEATGSWTGTGAYDVGKLDKAVEFDGTNYVSIADSNPLDLYGSFTFGFWFRPSIALNSAKIIDKGVYSVEYTKIPISNGVVNATVNGVTVSSGSMVFVDVPHFIAVAWSEEDQLLSLYVDGSLADSDTLASMATGTQDLKIGEGFKGIIDELIFYNRALSLIEINELYRKVDTDGINYCQPKNVWVDNNGTMTYEGGVNITGNITASYFCVAGDNCYNVFGNSSWNQSYADTLYAPISVTGDVSNNTDGGYNFSMKSNYGWTTTGTITGEQITSTDDINLNGKLTNTMSATDTSGLLITQVGGGYTGTSDVAMASILGIHAGTSGDEERDISGLSHSIYNEHILTGDTFANTQTTKGISNFVQAVAEHNASSYIALMEETTGMSNEVKVGGIGGNPRPLTARGDFGYQIEAIGMNNIIDAQKLAYNSSGDTLTLNLYGTKTDINTDDLTETAGTLTPTLYGNYVTLKGSLTTTDTGYGYYFHSSSQLTNSWGYYNGDINVADNFMGNDGSRTCFGDSECGDFSVEFDGTNPYFNYSNTSSVAYFAGNLSAENLIDRSVYWDKSLGKAFENTYDTDDINTDEDLPEFERIVYQVKDPNNCWEEVIKTQYCYDYNNTNYCFDEQNNHELLLNERVIEIKKERCGTKNETGRLISAVVGKHEQALHELTQNIDVEENLTIFKTSTLAEHYVTNTTKDPATLTKVENFYSLLGTKTYQEMKDMVLTEEGKLSDNILFDYEKSDYGSYNLEAIGHTNRAMNVLMLWKIKQIEDKQQQQLNCWDLTTQQEIVQCMRAI